MSTLAAAFARLLAVLDRLEVPYEVGGSVASSAHGVPRTTLDVDIVVDLKPERIDSFVDELRQEFYADAAQIREAFALGRAANPIHLGSVWKFDLFPLRNDEYRQTEFGQRTFHEIRPDGGERNHRMFRGVGGGHGAPEAGMVPRGQGSLGTAVERSSRRVEGYGRAPG
jgi:hypothetical protein